MLRRNGNETAGDVGHRRVVGGEVRVLLLEDRLLHLLIAENRNSVKRCPRTILLQEAIFSLQPRVFLDEAFNLFLGPTLCIFGPDAVGPLEAEDSHEGGPPDERH